MVDRQCRIGGHREITEEGELAERKRRGEDAVDDRLDEAFDDDTAVDDDLADDELDNDLDDEFDDDEVDEDEDGGDDDDEPVAARGRGTRGTSLTKTRTKDKDAKDKDAKDKDKAGTRPGTRGRSTKPGDKKSTKSKGGDRPNIFGRFANFVREVVAELRKVIWPTRKELLTYTGVVVAFVSLMLAIVFGLDWGFAKAVLWVFGDGEAAAGQ